MQYSQISEKEMKQYLIRGRVARARTFQKFFTKPRQTVRELFVK